MPGPAAGVRKVVAMKKSAVWNTAVACGAGDGISHLTGKANRQADVAMDESRGLSFSTDGTPGPITCTEQLVCVLRYAGLDLPIALMMGTAGAPAQQAATAAYKNTYKWNTDPYGLMATMATNVAGLYIEELTSMKITGITVSGEVGAKPLQIVFDIIGINKNTGSVVNTTTTFNNVTLAETENAVLFSQLKFRMNDRSGDALDDDDRIYPSKFTLSINRPLKGEYTGEYRTTTDPPQDLIDEPANDGIPEIRLTIELPKHTGNTNLAALGNDTRKKMDITATGATIADVYKYQHLWQFPHLQMTNVDPTDDNGRIKEPLEFLVHGCLAAPLGMVGITDPLWWTVINKRTTDPLG